LKKIIFVWLFLLAICGCSSTDICNRADNQEPVLHILFIGNSYTYVNDLPGTFTRLACSGGHKVETGVAANGGWTLAEHVVSSPTLDKLVERKWDYVVLQEQSEIPAVEASRNQSMYPAVRQLAGKIVAVGARPILFMTWGHRDGSSYTGTQNFSDMQTGLFNGYEGISQELGISIAPVGYAWYEARTQPNPINLWQDDGSHPNIEGTYLAACVFYATFYHKSPEGLAYVDTLSQDTAKTLQAIAADTVFKYHW
jgi:hypothetical protein